VPWIYANYCVNRGSTPAQKIDIDNKAHLRYQVGYRFRLIDASICGPKDDADTKLTVFESSASEKQPLIFGETLICTDVPLSTPSWRNPCATLRSARRMSWKRRRRSSATSSLVHARAPYGFRVRATATPDLERPPCQRGFFASTFVLAQEVTP
jgi:hypothetical protein